MRTLIIIRSHVGYRLATVFWFFLKQERQRNKNRHKLAEYQRVRGVTKRKSRT